jgi:hypothetical protein
MEQTGRQSAKERRRAQWRAVVAEAAASGLSIRQFCERGGIQEGHFYHWRHRLELEDRGEGRKGIPAKREARFALVRTEPGSCSAHADAGEIELVLERGWLLRIRRGVDEATLRSVLAALAAGR